MNLEIHRNEILCIFGDNSSGKSTLIYSILNELPKTTKSTKISYFPKNLKKAFVSQKRWLIGGRTIQENITLAHPLDRDLLDKVLKAAELDKDIKSNAFPEGLQTVITSSSDSVSGGQKTRIALARALYHQ